MGFLGFLRFAGIFYCSTRASFQCLGLLPHALPDLVFRVVMLLREPLRLLKDDPCPILIVGRESVLLGRDRLDFSLFGSITSGI